MITLLIEIALTCKAWKKGWKGWALAPMALGVACAFMIGMAIGASGGDPEAALAVGLFIDLTVIVALAILASKGPRTCAARAGGEQEPAVAAVVTSDKRPAA
jgi:hypothetical protein